MNGKGVPLWIIIPSLVVMAIVVLVLANGWGHMPDLAEGFRIFTKALGP